MTADQGAAAYVTPKGVGIGYRLHGAGPQAVVLVHGVGSYKEVWDGVLERLPRSFRVLTFDLRGHGASARVKGRYEIDDFVDDLLALAGHVGFDRFDLAGFSLGGLVAQRLVLTHPARVRRLALVSTVAGRTPDERQRVAARLEALKSGERGAHYDASLSRWLTEEFQARNPDIVARLRARNAENDPECYAAAYRVLAETDLGDELHRIACPTMVVTGEDDQGANPRMAWLMHERIAGSELHILPRLRHSVLTEAPDTIAGLLSAFFDQSRPTERKHG